MKKLISTLFIFLLLSCNVISAFSDNLVQPLNEGVYRVGDFIIPLEEINFVQNTSEKEIVYFTVVDENNAVVQSIRLEPNSEKFKVAPLKPGYRIIIVDYGTVVLSKE